MNIGPFDVGRAITATGTTQATAQLVINTVAVVTTTASGTGVLLQTCQVGTPQYVYNGGANALSVYPPVGYQINGLSANSPHLLAPNTTCLFVTVSSTQLIGLLSA